MRTLDKRLKLPSINDATPSLQLHYEAQMVSVGTPIKDSIPCTLVDADIGGIVDAISRPGRDVHVEIGRNGALTAFVTPGSAKPNDIAFELNYLDHYRVPEVIIPLSTIPRMGNGTIDSCGLKAKVEQVEQNRPAGGGGGESGSVEARIVEQIYRVTAAMAVRDDRLASAGIDSLNMIKLIAGLKSAFPEVLIPEIMLLNNPTIGELVEYVEAADPSDPSVTKRNGAKHMQMDACFGLRTILCLWIVRSHMETAVCPSGMGFDYEKGRPKPDFVWGDLTWVDVKHSWRVTIFVILAAMTASMKFENHRVSDWQKLKEFIPPLLPVLWFAMLFTAPLEVADQRLHALGANGIPGVLPDGVTEEDLEHGARIFWYVQLFFTSTMIFSWLPPPFILYLTWGGYTWYLGAQALFLSMFNWIQDLSKGVLHCGCSWSCCTGDCGTMCFCYRQRQIPTAKHTTKLLPFLTRLGLIGLIPMCMIGIPRVVLESKPSTAAAGMFFHYSGWLRLPQFYQGIVLGQGCLHVEINEVEAKWLGR